eukprot:14937038-Ditylum_brightwellii.AAC.1
MASAAEAEIGALYTNARKGEEFRTALQELNHPQPPMLIMTDNTTANRIVNDMMKQRRSRAIDMQFYWLKDRCKQGHFRVYWRPHDENKGDYHTRHHQVMYHINVRKQYLHKANSFVSNNSSSSSRVTNPLSCEGVSMHTSLRPIGHIT